MSIQSQFDLEAINLVPLVKDEILKAQHECSIFSNNMLTKTIIDISNSTKPIVNMSEKELEEFQLDLLEVFKFLEWTNK